MYKSLIFKRYILLDRYRYKVGMKWIKNNGQVN